MTRQTVREAKFLQYGSSRFGTRIFLRSYTANIVE